MKKIFRRVALVLLSVLICSVSIFGTVKSDLKIVKPLVVNADETVAQIIKRHFMEFLAVAAAYGLTFSVVWTQENIQKICDEYQAEHSDQSLTLTNSIKKGNDLIISNSVVSAAGKFWSWLQSKYSIGKNSLTEMFLNDSDISIKFTAVPAGTYTVQQKVDAASTRQFLFDTLDMLWKRSAYNNGLAYDSTVMNPRINHDRTIPFFKEIH